MRVRRAFGGCSGGSQMVSLTRAESKAARFVKNLDIDDLHDQPDTLRAYVHELSQSAGRNDTHQFGRARSAAGGERAATPAGIGELGGAESGRRHAAGGDGDGASARALGHAGLV